MTRLKTSLRRALVLFALLVLGFMVATPLLSDLLLTEAPTPFPPEYPHAAPWRLERRLLAPERKGLLFLVEHRSGLTPKNEALETLVSVASRHAGVPARWVWGNEDSCSPEEQCILILYEGKGDQYGRAYWAPSESAEAIPVLEVFQDELAKWSFLWLTRTRLEERTLLHEYGHLLGLGTNPEHAYDAAFPTNRYGFHCIYPECPLARLTAKSVLYAVYYTGLTLRSPKDYCEYCRRDIREARAVWLEGKKPVPVRQLPFPSADEWVRGLKERDLGSALVAQGAVFFGKKSVPALLGRLQRTVANNRVEGRAELAWLAMQVVMNEERKRSGAVCSFQLGDQYEPMLSWWNQHGESFLAGDDWPLPPVIRCR